MKKPIIAVALSVGLLLTGCSQTSDTQKPVKHEQVKKEEGTMKDALKQYKWIKVKDVVDARKNTGHVNVVVQLDDSQGERSQVGAVMSFTKKFIDALTDKPKTVTVGVMSKDMRVFQFTTNVATGEVTVDKSTPAIKSYLKKAGYLK